MKNKLNGWKRFLIIGLAGAVVLASVLMFTDAKYGVQALFNPDRAITYQSFSSKTTVDNSVLFIGTYIVHKDALTDSLYEKAQKSASDSGQNIIYYKSEFADGQWFDVSDVDNGLKGISYEGIPVAEDTVNPLYVTYYVGSDGIMIDALTMEPVNPFDVPDPYDLSALAELEPLWMQYTMSSSPDNISQEDFLKNRNSQDAGNLRSDVYYYQLLSTFFSLDLRDAQTDLCDEQLTRLNQSYIALKASGADDEAALVYELMSKVDATRRSIIMARLAEVDDNLLNTLYTLSTGSYYTPYGNFRDSSSEENADDQPEYLVTLEDAMKHDFATSAGAGMSSFISSWLERLGLKGSGSGGDGWWTVLEKSEEDKKKRAKEANSDDEDYKEDKAPSEYPFTADEALLDAIGTCMGNCAESYTQHLSKALVDTDDVLGHVIFDYSMQVVESLSGATLGGPVTYLKQATNIRDNKVGDKDGELALLQTSLLSLGNSKYESSATAGAGPDYGSMLSEAAKKSYLDDQKASLEADRSTAQFLIEAMRMRSKAPDALEYVNQRISATERLLNSIPSDDFKPMANSSVEAHLAWLREEAQKIIDSDESLKSKLDSLKDKKADLQGQRDKALDNNDLAGAKKLDAKIAAVDQDIADEKAKNGDGQSMANALTDKAMSKLADNANADLSGIADALAGLGEKDALDALKKKAADSGASKATLDGIDKASASAAKSGDPDAEALKELLESLFGKSVDEMSDTELAIATSVASRIARAGSEGGRILTGQLVNLMLSRSSKYIFRQYGENKATEYISMRAISYCTPFRYFYDDGKQLVTMTSGSKIYIYRRGSDHMHKQTEDSDPEMLRTSIVVSGDAYIGEDDGTTYFNCCTEYAVGTEYAILLTATMKTSVDEYYDEIQDQLDN